VDIVPPELSSGWGQVEAMLIDELDLVSAEIESTVEALMNKPKFMNAFIKAGASSALAASRLPFVLPNEISLLMGFSAAVQASPFDTSILDSLDDFDETTDLDLGAAVQAVNFQTAFDLSKAVPGLSLGLSASLFSLVQDDYSFTAQQLGAQFAWSFLPVLDKRPGFLWQGLRVGLGASYVYNSLNAVVDLGLIEQEVSYDLDDSGPLVPLTITLSLEPEAQIAYETKVFLGQTQISSAIVLGNFLHLETGIGLALYYGSGSLSLNIDEPITVEGYISDLIEEDGRLIISGTASEISLLDFFPFVYANLGFSTASFHVDIPVYYNFADGLALSLLVGVSF